MILQAAANQKPVHLHSFYCACRTCGLAIRRCLQTCWTRSLLQKILSQKVQVLVLRLGQRQVLLQKVPVLLRKTQVLLMMVLGPLGAADPERLTQILYASARNQVQAWMVLRWRDPATQPNAARLIGG